MNLNNKSTLNESHNESNFVVILNNVFIQVIGTYKHFLIKQISQKLVFYQMILFFFSPKKKQQILL